MSSVVFLLDYYSLAASHQAILPITLHTPTHTYTITSLPIQIVLQSITYPIEICKNHVVIGHIYSLSETFIPLKGFGSCGLRLDFRPIQVPTPPSLDGPEYILKDESSEKDLKYTLHTTLNNAIHNVNANLLIDEITDLEIDVILETSTGLFDVFQRVGRAETFAAQIRSEIVELFPKFLEISDHQLDHMRSQTDALREQVATLERLKKIDDIKQAELKYRENLITRLEGEVAHLQTRLHEAELQPLERAEFALLKAEHQVISPPLPKFPLLLREQALCNQLTNFTC